MLKKTAAALVAGMLSLGTLGATTQTTSAQGIGLGPAMFGLGFGAAFVNPFWGPYYYSYYAPPPFAPAPPMIYPQTNWSAHVAWCQNRYRTYNPATNTYFARPGVPAVCRSPFG